MRVLLDTCVISEIRKPNGHKRVKETVSDLPDDHLFISVISIGEIVKGIELLPKSTKKTQLQKWVQILETHFYESILNIDTETARIWGTMTAKARQQGISIPASDGLIASIAKRHGLHLMTRNVSDFKQTGVLIINPWDT